MSPVTPPRWSNEQFEVDRRTAISHFRDERMKEPLERYLEAFDYVTGVVEELLELTVDLVKLEVTAEQVLTKKDYLDALRYMSGPMVSAADLKTLTDASLAPTVLAKDKDMRDAIVETILMGIDRRRFPWLAEGRDPNEAERSAAVLSTAALVATQRVRTQRANESSAEQQSSVAEALAGAGFIEVERRNVANIKEGPASGEFCRSGMFGTRDADLIVGLWDERTMPIECKVSNSSENSIKRLNNDAAVKARIWVEEFGKSHVVPCAVLSGVYKRRNLEAAQRDDLTIFWAYKVDAMIEWIDSLRS